MMFFSTNNGILLCISPSDNCSNELSSIPLESDAIATSKGKKSPDVHPILQLSTTKTASFSLGSFSFSFAK
ncbi:hypothetical protein NEF87_000985 [Candidatus Lokiarchaeum ossiferum]|uniref:Uncharacterized protein n=1 Tax=Candidatus Lokiarchaeum ossiferum TaxID=2951803 RepID=A0ABY6HMF7_9ARCH|nr:hypothetical protein NEF87_000985 [Candidatus Lokiarchaeum sp. B-35]